MLQIMAGKLAHNAEIITVNTPYGEKECCNMRLHVYASKTDQTPVIVKVNAWEENAHELARYRKGDTIQFIGELKTFSGANDEAPSLGYTIKKIDRQGTLLKRWTEEINKFLHPNKDLTRIPEIKKPMEPTLID